MYVSTYFCKCGGKEVVIGVVETWPKNKIYVCNNLT
jgi:hypothetical protein